MFINIWKTILIKHEQGVGYIMGNDRKHILKFRVSDDELKVINHKVELANSKNISDYLRRLALSGRIINIDTSDLKESRKLISSISQNINQIAMRVNYQGTIYKDDIEEMNYKIEQIICAIMDIEKTLSLLKRGDL